MATVFINGRFLGQPVTGVQRFARSIVAELAQQRSDLVLLAPSDSAIPQEFAGIPVKQLGAFKGHAWEQISLPRFLASQGQPLLLNLTSTAPMRYRNQVVSHHDITYVRHPESFSLPFRLLYRAIVPPALRSARRIITVSEFSRTEIANHFRLDPAVFVVVYNAVGQEFEPLDNSVTQHREQGLGQAEADSHRMVAPEPFFLAVSSPNAHKNFARLIEAFTQTSLEAELRIIGAQSRSFSTQSQADDPRVKYLGRVDDDALIASYQQAYGFVFPSLYEGFGIPPLEAQQCGCPVIAARAASIPEVLGDSALYVDPYDVSSIKQALEQLFADQPLRQNLVERGLANVQRFSWQASAMKVSELIDSLS